METVGLLAVGIGSHLAAACLPSTSLYHDGQQQWAELTAWGLIIAYYRSKPHLQKHVSLFRRGSGISTTAPKVQRLEIYSTIIAVLIVVAQFGALYGDASGARWSFPLVSLVIFGVVRFDKSIQQGSTSATIDLLQPIPEKVPDPTRRHVPNMLATALFISVSIYAAASLRPKVTAIERWTLIPGVAYLALASVAYMLLARIGSAAAKDNSSFGVNSVVDEVLKKASATAFGATALCLLMSSIKLQLSGALLLLSILRAVEIFSSVSLALNSSAVAASTITTVATSVALSSRTTDPSLVLTYCLAATGTLAQIFISIPKLAASSIWLWIVLLLPFAALFNGLSSRPYEAGSGLSTLTSIRPGAALATHPIQQIFDDANKKFEASLEAESRNIDQAIKEYQRRYGRLPPRGFDKWFEIAKSKDFRYVDEFDAIYKSLEPFWGVAPSSLRARVRDLKDSTDTIQVRIGFNKAEYDGGHYHADYLLKWLNHDYWADLLPETTFYINVLDEPRIVAPHDTLSLAMSRAIDQRKTKAVDRFKSMFSLRNSVTWIDVERQDGFQAVLSSCAVDSPARQDSTHSSLQSLDEPLPFVTNITTNKDICASTDFLHGHGFFSSPASAKLSHTLVPIFSQCKPNIFNDILYPSPYYEGQMEANDDADKEDPDWSEKLPRLYWAGSGTGGWAMTSNWRKMHRMRLALMTRPDNEQPVHLLERNEAGMWRSISKAWSSISDLFHVRITGIVQCEEAACAEMEKQFAPLEGEPGKEAFQSKYALDIDGNSFSGRYYRLLKSKSCILKHTAFDEWHDGRLVPWVHFIPVSAGAEELGEMIRFLTQEAEGLAIGEKIAQQGKDWARATLRSEDLEVVTARIMLEYARLLRDDRDDWHV